MAFLKAAVGTILISQAISTQAETWDSASVGGNDARWSTATNWNPDSVPNGVGAQAIFGTPPATTRTIELDGQFTVGDITFQSDNNVTQSIRNFNVDGDLLTFDAAGDGPATVNVLGTGTSNNRLQANMFLQDDLILNVANIGNAGAAGTLAFTGTASGPGGVTKTGGGTVTLAANAGDTTQLHGWQGPTLVSDGRWRTSVLGTLGMQTESFTINGGQLLLITNNSSYTFGPGQLRLNGFGPISGPNAVFEGAIRPERDAAGRSYTITNEVLLESPTMVHQQGIAVDDLTHTLKFTGVITGGSAASLSISGLNSDQQLGRIVFTNANTYMGDTIVNGGRLEVEGASARFSLGDIIVHNPATVMTNGAGIAAAIARLVIPSGVLDAISDTAMLSLGGASRGIADLGAGINEMVGSLVLGGVTQTQAGTYGSTASSAVFQNDQFFAGTGVITIAAPPGQDGDYNEDGVVDAADYVAWRKSPGDFGGDPAGYNTWVANFGEGGAGSGGAGGVPEPSTLVIVGLTALLALAGARRRS
jgi:autotransporter-associated beta strand protein